MFQLNELKGIKICAKCATRIGCIAFYLADIRLLQTELFALQTELFSGFHLLTAEWYGPSDNTPKTTWAPEL